MAKAGDGKPRSNKRRTPFRLTKRVTQEDLDAFKRRAAAAGFDSAQNYLSAFVLGDIQLRVAKRQDATRAIGQLGAIGNNINQLARAANEGRIHSLDAQAGETLDQMRREIESLGRKIREAVQ